MEEKSESNHGWRKKLKMEEAGVSREAEAMLIEGERHQVVYRKLVEEDVLTEELLLKMLTNFHPCHVKELLVILRSKGCYNFISFIRYIQRASPYELRDLGIFTCAVDLVLDNAVVPTVHEEEMFILPPRGDVIITESGNETYVYDFGVGWWGS